MHFCQSEEALFTGASCSAVEWTQPHHLNGPLDHLTSDAWTATREQCLVCERHDAQFRERGWRRPRYLPPRLRGDMATETAVALDSNFKLLLMSRILVALEKMVASCHNRDQTWLCVYCWCQTPSGVVSPRRAIARAQPSGVWHQQYTHNHVWSLKYVRVEYKCLTTCKHQGKHLRRYLIKYLSLKTHVQFNLYNTFSL